jgi:surface antigen
MTHRHRLNLRCLPAAVIAVALPALATQAGSAAGSAVARGLEIKAPASVGLPFQALAARGGRTTTPSLAGRGSYRVRAGENLRILVHAYAVWGRPRTCSLTVERGSYRRSFRVSGVVSNFLAVLRTSRQARAGVWNLAVGCRARRQRPSRLARRAVIVSSSRAARGSLTGRSRPEIEPLQASRPAQIGKFGLGGTPPNPGFPNGQCTYFAYEQRPDIYWTSVDSGAPRSGWDADKWSVYAAQYGHFPEGGTPLVGSVMVEPASSRSWVGHVAYVTQVLGGSQWITQEMNTDGNGTPNKVFTVVNDFGPGSGYYYVAGQLHRHVVPGTVFIYGGPVLMPPTPPTTTATTTTPAPTTTTTTATTTTTTAPPPPPSWSETAGGVTHTWTNYMNAGGTQGPSIASNQTIAVSCAVQGFAVADGDTWWYRIHSSPWNDTFYASADAFYNNGQTSGSLLGTPFVDPAVAHC